MDDLTSGRGPFGFLERDYQIVERVRERIEGGGSGGLVVGVAGGAVSVAAGVLSAIAAIATITVMVIFLLLGGPRWVESFLGSLPDPQRERWSRVGFDLYRSVGGYVRGNLAISLIAGISAAFVLLLLGVPVRARARAGDRHPRSRAARRRHHRRHGLCSASSSSTRRRPRSSG